MLPLLPMHPQAVPPFSPNLESLTVGLPDGSDLASQQFLVRETRATHQHSFPIRTSRASGRSATAGALPVHASFQEHNLRRKTPNGTIDAGYDGSPTQLSPASRPLKHMILTGRVSTGHSPRNAQILPFRQTVPHTEAFLGQNHIGDDGVNRSSRPIFNNDDYSQDHARGGFDPASGRYPHWRGQQQPHIYPQNHHRHLSVYANGNNDWTFGPPPYPMNESLPFGQMKRPIGFSPWNYPNPDQASSFRTGHFSISPGAATYGEFGSDQAYQSAVSHGLLHDPMTNIRHSQHPHTAYMPLPSSTGLVAGAQDGANPAYPQFKEKVLLQAHRSYVDLLAYLQTTRKLHHGKAGSNTHPSSRLLIYPKPPKPTIKEQASFTTKICSTSTSNSSFGIGIDDIGQNQYQPSAARQISSNRPVHSSIGSGFPERTNALVRLDEPRSLPSFGVAENGYPVPLGGYISAPGSALGNARSSLQLIQNLCEQSGWKWIDGLLLAGCLQYGLEQYSNALKSFSRITALDSSHVEAIANTAATLYCLDRQQEAEQRWLDAVKLRPDYLEAAEHLVGLLYRKRSKEAVEIIDHVQQALRLPQEAWRQLGDSTLPRSGACQTAAGAYGKTALHGHGGDQDGYSTQSASDRMLSNPHETKRTGFGSSGYAIPGEDNGRILALIHAKGTMLYSLRDVARASEAFEEAVMISVGRCMSGIWDLVQRIQAVLSSSEGPLTPSPTSQSLSPLLLPPEKARLTAQLVFRGTGELPGLVHVTEGGPKRAAFQTTSNSLLSLAKIFQDSASSGATGPGKLRQPSGVGDILALYYLSLSLQESPSTANNVGILLAGVQHIVASQPTRWENALPHPSLSGIPPGSGLALALAYYHYGLRLDPKHVHLHTNLGSLLKDIGHLDLAIQMYERAVSCDGTFDIALTNLANAVKDRGRTMDAINYYRRAVSSNPNFAEAVCGLLTALNSVCDWRGRGGVILSSGKYDRWHVNDEGMLLDAHAQREGSGLTKRAVDIVRQQLEEASQWGRQTLHKDLIQSLAGELQHHCSSRNTMVEEMLQSWIGKPWEGTRLLRLIERALRVIMRKWYLDKYVLRTADDKQRYPRPRLPASLTVPSAPTVLPFHTFTTPLEAQDIRIISQRNALRISCSALRSSWLPMETYKPPPPPRPQLNVGYISSDFNNHPLAHLMQSVFGFHDARRVHAVCYATTPSDKSTHRLKIEREAPVFRDVSNWPPDKLVEQIVKDEIHILVNLNGYTRGARNEIFAARPAPIQMSFMGFAGTMGAEWCDYILADTTAIPPSTLRPWRDNVHIEDVFTDNNEDDDHGDWVYSENIIFCRDTFFCCDHAQSCDASERNVSWSDEERRRWEMRKELFPALSDDTIILGNFNQLYKIEPTTFRSWLRILARLPKAVLWLLRFPETGEANLRRAAQSWMGSEISSRLIFTDVAPKNQHIARARVCDLFLDTPECNAHTTAADVLWSSTPLLTLPRYPYKMCSRMAASILKGALPKTKEGHQASSELIAADEVEYEQTAIRLGSSLSYSATAGGYRTGSGRLAEIRRLLWDSKWSCSLFNTRRWVDDVETAYEEAWRRFVAGQGGDIYL